MTKRRHRGRASSTVKGCGHKTWRTKKDLDQMHKLSFVTNFSSCKERTKRVSYWLPGSVRGHWDSQSSALRCSSQSSDVLPMVQWLHLCSTQSVTLEFSGSTHCSPCTKIVYLELVILLISFAYKKNKKRDLRNGNVIWSLAPPS